MKPSMGLPSRRQFVTGAAAAASFCGLQLLREGAQAASSTGPDLLVIGPQPGYTPHIGVLVSELTYIQTRFLGL
jgi:hypothetical protein